VLRYVTLRVSRSFVILLLSSVKSQKTVTPDCQEEKHKSLALETSHYKKSWKLPFFFEKKGIYKLFINNGQCKKEREKNS
jgi:hypothetical protein